MSSQSKKAVPTAIATGLDIGLSNFSLKSITLSFYSKYAVVLLPLVRIKFRGTAMCKSSSLIFVLLFAFLFQLETFSWRLVAVIFLIFAGVLLMVATEAEFVLQGFILVISASALGGLRWSLTQVLLKTRKMGFDNPVSTIYWLAPCMAITLGIVSVSLENWPSLFWSGFFRDASHTTKTMLLLLVPGVVAFFMVLSEF